MAYLRPNCDHLHLGCGTTSPDGWLNVDGSLQVTLARHPWVKALLVSSRLLPRRQAEILWSSHVIRLNLRKRLPFADNSFRVIYCSHMLEHLYFEDGRRLLKECYRVLQPHGICRFVVPDLASAVERYRAAKSRGDPDAASLFMQEISTHEKEAAHGPLGIYRRLTAFHQHKWMYDGESLRALFVEAGFSDAKPHGYLESRIERIREVEMAGRILNGEGIAVEGTKRGERCGSKNER